MRCSCGPAVAKRWPWRSKVCRTDSDRFPDVFTEKYDTTPPFLKGGLNRESRSCTLKSTEN